MCTGTHMKTIVTEVVNSVRRRMLMRDMSGCEAYGSEMAVSEARDSEILNNVIWMILSTYIFEELLEMFTKILNKF